MIRLTVASSGGKPEYIFCKDRTELKKFIDTAKGLRRKVLGVKDLSQPPKLEDEPSCVQLELFDDL